MTDTTLVAFVTQKRLNFARFIRENTINNHAVVETHIGKMLALDPILFLQFVKYNAAGKQRRSRRRCWRRWG